MNMQTKVYDEQLSLELAGGNQDLARQMLDMLLKELPELQATMNEAYRACDKAALYESVHKINGSSRYCGVPAVGQAANELEALLKENNDVLESSLDKLNTEIGRLMAL